MTLPCNADLAEERPTFVTHLECSEPGDRVVLFNCGTGLKYPMTEVSGTIHRHKPVDYAAMNTG